MSLLGITERLRICASLSGYLWLKRSPLPITQVTESIPTTCMILRHPLQDREEWVRDRSYVRSVSSLLFPPREGKCEGRELSIPSPPPRHVHMHILDTDAHQWMRRWRDRTVLEIQVDLHEIKKYTQGCSVMEYQNVTSTGPPCYKTVAQASRGGDLWSCARQ